MRLVLFQRPGTGQALHPGVLTDQGVVDVSSATSGLQRPRRSISCSSSSMTSRLCGRHSIGLLPSEHPCRSGAFDCDRPCPGPGKILCCIGNYWEHAQREPRPLNMFLKNPDAVIGPGDTVELPEFTDPWVFQHEAELALVIRGPAKRVSQDNWRKAIFGYQRHHRRVRARAGSEHLAAGKLDGQELRYVRAHRTVHHHVR